MYQDILNFPLQFAADRELFSHDDQTRIDFTSLSAKKIRKIYLAGMGGSSLAGDLVNDYLSGEISMTLVRDYCLPPQACENDLVLCASYSGNTEETISVFKEALEKKVGLVVLAHGGELKKMAEEKGIFFIQIPETIQPRCAIGHFFVRIIFLLEQLAQIPVKAEFPNRLADFLHQKRDEIENKGKELALELRGMIPIIYAPTEMVSAARIWKIKMNENVKIPSFFNVFPELNHNEMVGWTRINMKSALIFLVSRFMNPRIKKRMEVMAGILDDRMPIHWVALTGNDWLQETFEAIWIADFTTYYMAIEAGIDPAPVEMVEDFKKKLSS